VLGRQVVCNDPQLVELAGKFIPVSEDFYRFHVAKEQAGWGKPKGVQTEEFQFFQRMLDQARMLARQGDPSALIGEGCHTQGMYVLTPNGKVLGMMHQWDRPDLYVAMLKQSLSIWNRLKPAERRWPQAPNRAQGKLGDVMRTDLFPADGLALTDITRALPYAPEHGPHYEPAIASHPMYARLDHAWFRKHEARQFLPKRIEPGAEHQVPRSILERLARFHLGTNTDTIAGPFGERTIKEARLNVRVVAVENGRVDLSMQGTTLVDGPQDSAGGKHSGFRAKLLGRMVYDLKTQRFVAFDLVALGIRQHGGGEIRQDTPNPIPLGVLLSLAGNAPADRLPPAYLERYGW
jgi:hypothetical protein